MFYLTTHSTHFIYGYMASDIWLRTILIVRKETRCRNIGYSYRLTARVLLYAPSHRQDNTYHNLCYTSRGALAGTRYSKFHYERSIRRPIAPWANALPLSYVPLLLKQSQASSIISWKKMCWDLPANLPVFWKYVSVVFLRNVECHLSISPFHLSLYHSASYMHLPQTW